MKTMYQNLMDLCSTNDAFFFKDFQRNQRWYRIFNYRLASYTDFLLPSALECRGIMFEITNEGAEESDYSEYIALTCRPQEKFFNVNEVSTDINTLCEALIKQGRLSRDVYERAKGRNN